MGYFTVRRSSLRNIEHIFYTDEEEVTQFVYPSWEDYDHHEDNTFADAFTQLDRICIQALIFAYLKTSKDYRDFQRLKDHLIADWFQAEKFIGPYARGHKVYAKDLNRWIHFQRKLQFSTTYFNGVRLWKTGIQPHYGRDHEYEDNIVKIHALPHIERGARARVSSTSSVPVAMSIPVPDTLFTPLHQSAKAGVANKVCMELLLGADPNAEDKHGLTPVHYAAYHGHTKVVKLLLLRNPLIQPTRLGVYGPVDLAVRSREVEVLVAFVEADVDVLGHYGDERETLLVWATNAEQLKRANPPRSLEEFETDYAPLLCSLIRKYPELLADLLDQQGHTILHMAVLLGMDSVLQICLDSPGLNVNMPAHGSGNTALHYAMMSAATPMIKMLLRHPDILCSLTHTNTKRFLPVHCLPLSCDQFLHIQMLSVNRSAELIRFHRTPSPIQITPLSTRPTSPAIGNGHASVEETYLPGYQMSVEGNRGADRRNESEDSLVVDSPQSTQLSFE